MCLTSRGLLVHAFQQLVLKVIVVVVIIIIAVTTVIGISRDYPVC